MDARAPSRTARDAAAQRAAHQTLEGGRVFADPFARAILGGDADPLIAAAASDDSQASMRLFLAARSRFGEDALSGAVGRGARQIVVLGAGLDTFALRNPHTDARVFEVDHPATQAWKRERLAAAGLVAPPSLVFAPVDFERQSLADGLAAVGFAADRPTFFLWLGVVPFLTRAAIGATLDFVASAASAELVFDYSEPVENYPPERRAGVDAYAARAAAAGEPWLSHFDPAAMARELRDHGLEPVEDLGFADLADRYLGPAASGRVRGPGPHVIHARRAD